MSKGYPSNHKDKLNYLNQNKLPYRLNLNKWVNINYKLLMIFYILKFNEKNIIYFKKY